MAVKQFMLDGQATELLRNETIAWLSTVRPDQRPHLVPVGFVWDGQEEILIFSQPESQKVRNLRQNQHVMLSLGTGISGDLLLLEGIASLPIDEELRATLPDYAQKYEATIARLGMTVEGVAKLYSQAIRVKLTRVVSGS